MCARGFKKPCSLLQGLILECYHQGMYFPGIVWIFLAHNFVGELQNNIHNNIIFNENYKNREQGEEPTRVPNEGCQSNFGSGSTCNLVRTQAGQTSTIQT